MQMVHAHVASTDPYVGTEHSSSRSREKEDVLLLLVVDLFLPSFPPTQLLTTEPHPAPHTAEGISRRRIPGDSRHVHSPGK